MSKQSNNIFVQEDDLFYFETDHLALKGNKDYCSVLKVLVVLAAQRDKALKDFKKIVELREKALQDPLGTFEKIQNGETLGIPPNMELPNFPQINFHNYGVEIPEDDLKEIYSSSKSEDNSSDINQQVNANNKAWSSEEQKKLEELLMVYPPEPVEMRRFQKIAKALGNRTVKQVMSRVQKYFLKLYRAGLPIPGRAPKSSEKYRKSVLHRHQRHNHYLWKPTTFFPDLCVPVKMTDDDTPGPSLKSSPSTSAANYLIPTSYQENNALINQEKEQDMRVQLLKEIRVQKEKEQDDNFELVPHEGYRCDYCDIEPIIGSRWHCVACKDSVDFCTDCAISQMYSDNPHPPEHKLVLFCNTSDANMHFSDTDSNAGSICNSNNYDSDSVNYDSDFSNVTDKLNVKSGT